MAKFRACGSFLQRGLDADVPSLRDGEQLGDVQGMRGDEVQQLWEGGRWAEGEGGKCVSVLREVVGVQHRAEAAGMGEVKEGEGGG